MTEAATPAPMPVAEFLERSRTDRDIYFAGAVRIRPKDTKHGLIPFRMKPGQRRVAALIDSLRESGRPPRIVVLKGRQFGISTFAGAELFRRCHVFEHQQALITAHKAESAEYLFGNLQRLYNNLPDAVRPDKKYSTKRLMHFEANDSRLQVEVAGESRGFTAQLVHISELGFIEKADELLTAILQTVPDTPESMVIAESTANGVGNALHRLYLQGKKEGSGWVSIFLAWHQEPECRIEREDWPKLLGLRDILPLSDEEEHRRATYNLDLEQVAWWRYTLDAKCLGDMDKMAQEYPDNDQEAFLASGRPVMDRKGLQHYVEVLAEYRDSGRKPDLYEIFEDPGDQSRPVLEPAPRGRLRVYAPPLPRHRYILAADLSEGDPGSDPSPTVVLNRHSLSLDAVWYGRMPPDLKARTDHAIARYYNSATWGWEANAQGILYGHVAYQQIHYPDIHWRRTNEESVSGRVTDKPGFWTSGANRDHLFNLVRRYVRERAGQVWDEDMIAEWQSLRYDDRGRADHGPDSHSDLTLAFAIALAMHAGALDAALVPLSAESLAASVHAHQLNRSALSMGRPEPLQLRDGMTGEDVERWLEREHRRAARAGRIGTGRMT